jgi:uncharacterized protein with GYD domain
MPTYVLLSTLTPEGRRTLHSNPDRLVEVNKEIEAFGCTVWEQYALLGPYDFMSIVEAEDNATIAHLTMALGSRGTVNIMALPAIPRMEFHAKLVGNKQLGRK